MLDLPMSNWYLSIGSEVSVEESLHLPLHLFSTRVNEERYLDFLDLFLCLGMEIHEEKPLKTNIKHHSII